MLPMRLVGAWQMDQMGCRHRDWDADSEIFWVSEL